MTDARRKIHVFVQTMLTNDMQQISVTNYMDTLLAIWTCKHKLLCSSKIYQPYIIIIEINKTVEPPNQNQFAFFSSLTSNQYLFLIHNYKAMFPLPNMKTTQKQRPYMQQVHVFMPFLTTSQHYVVYVIGFQCIYTYHL